MGWDVYAAHENKKRIKVKAFEKAVKRVLKKADSVDGLLHIGGLDCSDCREMLEEATGIPAAFYSDYSPDELKKISDSANWDFTFEQENAWAYWSAREFLETCVRLNLGTYATY